MFKSVRQLLWPQRRWARVALYAAVAWFGLSSVLYFAVAGGGQPRPAAVATQATGAPAAKQPGAPLASHPGTAAGAAAQTASAPLKPTNPSRVAVWHAGHGGAALESLSEQLGNVLMTHGARQFLLMKSACAKLAAGVTAAQANPPIPDAAMQRSYQTALAELAKAATDCQAAISERPDGDETVDTHENAAMLNQATSALSAGAKELYRATYKINNIKRS